MSLYRELAAVPGLGLACAWTQSTAVPHEHLVVPDGCIDIIAGLDGGVRVAGPDTGPRVVRLRDQTVGLEDVWGAAARRIDEAADLRPIEVLQRAVAARLSRVGPPDAAVAATARALVRGDGVAETARTLGLSERQLRRRCLVAFGYGPKMLQRVLRFQRALALARSGAPLVDVAYAQGYADQAHLAHEVRDLAGVPLGALR
jgi:AraC-like DNA-binding protein